MVGGDPGPAGLPAQSHAVQGSDLDLEVVIILLRLMVVVIVQGQSLQLKIVTHAVVQV